LLWEELSGIFHWWDVSRCIEDFNVTRYSNERVGVPRSSSAMREFFEFISNQGLLDLPLTGGSFTWSNNQDPPSLSRIDRFLVSLLWEEHLPDLVQRRLPSPLSNHFPLLLDSGGMIGVQGLLNLRTCG
jgi:hypothetical protein